MKLTDEPRPALREATLAIMTAVEPWMHLSDPKAPHDFPALLSALATVMAMVSAGRAFLVSDDEAAQLAAITSDEADILKSFTTTARLHLEALNGRQRGGG